jgi:glycolate oxidase FAD binding subunit
MTTFQARTVEEVQDCVRAHADQLDRSTQAVPLRAVAGRSKSALSAPREGCVTLDVSALAGIIDYEPAECTFTARAATRIADVDAMLAEHGQYLPFEPPFADRGATLCGTVAAALSGPGRLRYGGVRDFLLGVRFVDGEGRIIRGGGRVVKNAAGFYLQHLMIGSLGTLGVLTEVTFKVFPGPQARATIVSDHESLTAAVDALARLRRSPFELEAAELLPPGRLLLRLGGSSDALPARVRSLSTWLHTAGAAVRELTDADEARDSWHEARELTWAPAGVPLVKVATTLGGLGRLDQQMIAAGNPARRYGAGGDLAWIAWPHPLTRLDALLTELRMPGLVVVDDGVASSASSANVAAAPNAGHSADRHGGESSQDSFSRPFLGSRPDPAFLSRVRRTFDPRGVFSPRPDGD